MRPSKPESVTRPAMPRKLAALMKSPARARPFWKPVTLEPAAKNSLVVFVLRAAQPVMPSVAAMKTKKKMIAVTLGVPRLLPMSALLVRVGLRRWLRRHRAHPRELDVVHPVRPADVEPRQRPGDEDH